MTKLVLNILLPCAKVSETYPKDHPWYKRLEVVKNIDGILSKYDNVERHIVFVEETGSMAKLKVLLTNGWSLHATDKNIYSKLGKLISSKVGDYPNLEITTSTVLVSSHDLAVKEEVPVIKNLYIDKELKKNVDITGRNLG